MAIENVDELIRKFENLQHVLDTSEPLDEACLLVENTAKIKCPVDSGQLRNSITHQVVGDVGYVGTNVFYAPYVEYGTGVFAAKGNGRQDPWSYCDAKGNWHTTIGQRPQPFLEPALEENREMIGRIFAIFIERELGNA